MLEENEKKQIEEWTQKKCTEFLFDSEKDDWNYQTSVFDTKIINKSNLLFLLEDTENNKCGYFFNGTITTTNNWIKGNNSFMFILQSNGRINKMMKFEEQNNTLGLFVGNKDHEHIYHINWGYTIHKEKTKSESMHGEHPSYFNLHGTTKAFHKDLSPSGVVKFTPKRFVVLQMK